MAAKLLFVLSTNKPAPVVKPSAEMLIAFPVVTELAAISSLAVGVAVPIPISPLDLIHR